MARFLKKSIRQNAGFTLVEALVAISIFSMSLIVVMGVLSRGIASTTFATQRNIATYLAQEGIEYMRNMRDTFVLYDATSPTNGWTSFKNHILNAPASCGGAPGCYFNPDSLNYANQTQPIDSIPLTACSGTCPALLYESATGKYVYTASASTVATTFVRKISEIPVGASTDEIKIVSTVTWTQGSGSYTTTFSENLFNWVE